MEEPLFLGVYESYNRLHTGNLSPWDVEARGSGVQSQPLLHKLLFQKDKIATERAVVTVAFRTLLSSINVTCNSVDTLCHHLMLL